MTNLMLVEIPQNSNVKYEIHDDILMVDRISKLPYPYAYGYFVDTLAEDGDALDAIILNHVNLHPGAVVRVKPVGMVQMKDQGVVDNKILVIIEGTEAPVDAERSEALARLDYFFRNYKEGTEVETVYIQGDSGTELQKIINTSKLAFEIANRI